MIPHQKPSDNDLNKLQQKEQYGDLTITTTITQTPILLYYY